MSFDSVSTDRANCGMMTLNVHDLIMKSNAYMLLVENWYANCLSHLFEHCYYLNVTFAVHPIASNGWGGGM